MGRRKERKMSDLEIIDLVAQTWVENGGDSDGFKWCMDSIKNRIHIYNNC